MGASYYKTVTQWSKGEYLLARNGAGTSAGTFQDEVAVISTYIPLVVDDHGNNMATASWMPSSPLSVNGANKVGGVIGTQLDMDYFKFRADPGTIMLQGIVSTASPDLKLALSLYDSGGTLLLTNIGATTDMGAAITQAITASGIYYLKVEGLGMGLPTNSYNDYGSLGRYALTGSWPLYTGVAAVPLWTNSTANIYGVPYTATFDGTSSTSLGATITSYAWDFGDSKGLAVNNTSILAQPYHTYAAPGDYLVSLRVSDSLGTISSAATVMVHVTGVYLANHLKVAAMNASWRNATNVENAATVAIQCVNIYGQPARYAAVYINVTGSLNGKAAARSDASGMVYISMPKQLKKASLSYTFTVSNITLAGYSYTGAENVISSVTISQNP